MQTQALTSELVTNKQSKWRSPGALLFISVPSTENELPLISDLGTTFVEDNDDEPDDKYIKLELRALFLEDNITPPDYHGDFDFSIKDYDNRTHIDADSLNCRRRHIMNTKQLSLLSQQL
ncbi:hypothetical protein H0H92_009585 [Tricholoma furcatifolium]|nr:hypothetical protein H0H92_009585 [Tricholoma furcatifolium]